MSEGTAPNQNLLVHSIEIALIREPRVVAETNDVQLDWSEQLKAWVSLDQGGQVSRLLYILFDQAAVLESAVGFE